MNNSKDKSLSLLELVAIALGGMVGGGIFSILGVAAEHVGNATPVAILIGGVLAYFAAFSYVRLAKLYKDEGATYSFFKKTYPNNTYAISAIGWLIVFGYISTLALYAFTFSSYLCSQFEPLNNGFWRKGVAGGIIAVFATINIISVKGMGKVEDWMVYTKLVILAIISGLLATHGEIRNVLPIFEPDARWSEIMIVAAITFVAYEGFQLVIHAYNEMDKPDRNIPRAIYSSIGIATIIYIGLSLASFSAIPKARIIEDKEYALAAGAEQVLGEFGLFIVILGALLATSSAISGTLFGASRLMAVVAKDGYFPSLLQKKVKKHIPKNAILVMSTLSFLLLLSGGLQLILEFGSVTFIVVSLLMAISNHKVRHLTKSNPIMTMVVMIGLLIAGLLIVYFEYHENRTQFIYILVIYALILIGAMLFGKKRRN
jgi:amino acid transporter